MRSLFDTTRRAHRVDLHVPTSTIVKLILAAGVVWLILRLRPELIFLACSCLLAIALAPAVAWTERRGVPRWVAVVGLAAIVLGTITLFGAFVLPPLVAQITSLAEDLPGLHARIVEKLRPSPFVAKALDRVFELPGSPEVVSFFHHPVAIGVSALSGATTSGLVVVMTLYFLVDGKRLYAWLLAYVPRQHRTKMAETAPAVSKVVYSFVRGQAVVSALFAVYTAIVVSVLGVPGVLPIALLAFVCDVIPVVGIIIATIPTAMLALTESPAKAVAIVISFMGYHMFETYVIIPRVYGSSMRLSTLTVLIALVIGGSLQGIIGAIFALPIVAAYPIVERIWLRGYLSDDVLRDHAALERASGAVDDEIIDAVILGEARRDPIEEARARHRLWRRRRLFARLRRVRRHQALGRSSMH
jgi:predicted PurR-regulated permease PerM